MTAWGFCLVSRAQIEQQTWRDYMRAARKARDARLLEEKCVPLYNVACPLLLPPCAATRRRPRVPFCCRGPPLVVLPYGARVCWKGDPAVSLLSCFCGVRAWRRRRPPPPLCLRGAV